MSIVSSHQSVLTNALSVPFRKPNSKSSPPASVSMIRCCNKSDYNAADCSPRENGNKLAKLAIVALAAGMLTLGGPALDAFSAKSGGRVGGQSFRPSAPRPSGPRINNSRTNIYINPPVVAPPLVGGFGGYGVPYYGGGWGWSPFSFFAPGPSVAVGIGGGFDVLVLFMVLGTIAAVFRRFVGSRDEGDDY